MLALTENWPALSGVGRWIGLCRLALEVAQGDLTEEEAQTLQQARNILPIILNFGFIFSGSPDLQHSTRYHCSFLFIVSSGGNGSTFYSETIHRLVRDIAPHPSLECATPLPPVSLRRPFFSSFFSKVEKKLTTI